MTTNNLKRSQNIFHQIMVNFEINNLATLVCIKDRGKVVPGRVKAGDPKLIS